MSTQKTEARGVAQLGYLGFSVSDLAAWDAFCTGILGLLRVPDDSRSIADAADENTGALAYRMDGHAHRILVERGTDDDLAFLGWELESEAALLETVERVREAGTHVVEAGTLERQQRRVARLFLYLDPAGIPSELFCGPELQSTPFSSPLVRAGFVADELGLGHVVLSASDPQKSRAFYEQALGFRLSDHVICDIHGYAVNIAFYHSAKSGSVRHHTVAIGDPQEKRIHHFMIEARSVDEVGLCFDRTLKARLRIMHTLGRHPNDQMFSFYAKTPSGFQFEFGHGGRSVDDQTWTPTTWDRISDWGHHPPQFLVPRK